MSRNRKVVKGLIELAQTIEEADQVLCQEFSSVPEKFAYLKGMFDFSIIDAYGRDIDTDYKAALSAIVNQKWRA